MAEETLFTDIIDNLGKTVKKIKGDKPGKLFLEPYFNEDGSRTLVGGYGAEDRAAFIEKGKDGIKGTIQYGNDDTNKKFRLTSDGKNTTGEVVFKFKDGGITTPKRGLVDSPGSYAGLTIEQALSQIFKTQKTFKNKEELLGKLKTLGLKGTNIKTLTPSRYPILRTVIYTDFDSTRVTEQMLEESLGKEKLDKLREEGLSEKKIKNRVYSKKYFKTLPAEKRAQKVEKTRQRNKNLTKEQTFDRKEKALVRRQATKGYSFYKVNKAESLLWNDLLRTAKNKNGYFKFKGEVPISGKYYNKVDTEKFVLIDKKGNEFKYSTLSEDIKKHSGQKLDDVLRPYKQKEFLAREGLTKELNKLYGYEPGTTKSVFHTQHIEGIDKNPFKVHLTFGNQNLKEAASKKSFNADWKVSKNYSQKKTAINNYYKSLGPDIVAQIGKKPKGTTKPLIDLLDQTGIKLKPDLKTKAISLGSFPAQLAEAPGMSKAAIKTAAKSVGKVLGVAALPLEAYFMKQMYDEGKTMTEILSSPLMLDSVVGDAQDLLKMNSLERQAVTNERIANDESLLDTDFSQPYKQGLQSVNTEMVKERVAQERAAEEAKRVAKRNKLKQSFTLEPFLGIKSFDSEV